MEGTPVADTAAQAGTDASTFTRERPGLSAFALEHDVVYHYLSLVPVVPEKNDSVDQGHLSPRILRRRRH